MISFKSKTLFEDRYFPCPDYLAIKAIKAHEDLYCIYGDKQMIIREMDILPKKIMEKGLFPDPNNQNKGKPFMLWYYIWNPKTKSQLDREFLE